MSWNDALNRALEQARAMQRSAGDALNHAAEEMKPHLEQSLKQAQELQATLAKHASESGAVASEQSSVILGHVGEFIKTGNQAMRDTAEQARTAAGQMTEQAKKVVDAASAAMARKPDEPPAH
jgi:hypothetical protein